MNKTYLPLPFKESKPKIGVIRAWDSCGQWKAFLPLLSCCVENLDALPSIFFRTEHIVEFSEHARENAVEGSERVLRAARNFPVFDVYRVHIPMFDKYRDQKSVFQYIKSGAHRVVIESKDEIALELESLLHAHRIKGDRVKNVKAKGELVIT
ncbi:hypothetical protein AMTR_s00033p00232550 [Amborella trichopoda]|uniref:Uncharacterized protein n=1 Tax=Amborella trichopoda TaxID=13333 RepID=U5CZ23_AMBTC|nr:hypothetical protein AMTR_s00033p00232550 [Amborella trichopoda]